MCSVVVMATAHAAKFEETILDMLAQDFIDSGDTLDQVFICPPIICDGEYIDGIVSERRQSMCGEKSQRSNAVGTTLSMLQGMKTHQLLWCRTMDYYEDWTLNLETMVESINEDWLEKIYKE